MRRAHKIRLITVIYANFYITLHWDYAVSAHSVAKCASFHHVRAFVVWVRGSGARLSLRPFRLTVLLIAFARAPGNQTRSRVGKRWRCRCDTVNGFRFSRWIMWRGACVHVSLHANTFFGWVYWSIWKCACAVHLENHSGRSPRFVIAYICILKSVYCFLVDARRRSSTEEQRNAAECI